MNGLAVRRTVLSILLEQSLYGEWWIDDEGYSQYADGDIGDQNHESLAFESALGVNFEELGTQVENYATADDILDIVKRDLVLSAEVAEEVGKHIDQVEPEDVADFFAGVVEGIMPSDLDNMQAAVLLGVGANDEAVKFFRGREGDARDYQMVKNNWIRVQEHNFQMGVFDDDAKNRIAEFLISDLGFDPEGSKLDRETITIEEMETQDVTEADIRDVVDPHKTALQIKQKQHVPAGAAPGIYTGGGPEQL